MTSSNSALPHFKKPISISHDPWEAYNDFSEHNQLTLSNIEFTTTNLCNMRCSHCAVGYTLQTSDPTPLPMDLNLSSIRRSAQFKNDIHNRWRTYVFKKIY